MKELSNKDLNRLKGLLSFLMTGLFWILLGSSLSNITSLFLYNINNDILNSPYYSFIKVNIPFIAMALGLYYTNKYLLQISFKQLITNNKKYCKSYFFITMVISFIYLLLYMIIANAIGYKIIEYNIVPLKLRIIMIILVIAITPFQSALEELLFRALLLRATIGKYEITNKIQSFIGSFICGIIFLIVHLRNPEIEAYRNFAMLYYFTFGFASAFITLYFRTVEISIALHITNNLFVGLISNYSDSALQTSSLFNEVGNAPHYFDLIIVLLIFTTTFFTLKQTTFYKDNKSVTNL